MKEWYSSCMGKKTNLEQHGLFKAQFTISEHVESLAPTVLLNTVKGEEDLVQKLIIQSSEHLKLITVRGSIKDDGNREFSNISAFQYALWAMDWRMCEMFLKSIYQKIDEDGSNYEAMEQLRHELLKQYHEVTVQGLSYTRSGIIVINSKQFSFKNLITALKCLTHEDSWTPINVSCLSEAQKELPANIAQEYCQERPFYPMPSFKEPLFTRTLTTERLYTYAHGAPKGVTVWGRFPTTHWWSVPSDTVVICGYGMYYESYYPTRYNCGGAKIGRYPEHVRCKNPKFDILESDRYKITLLCVKEDLAAITALHKIRTKDIASLGKLISKPFSTRDELEVMNHFRLGIPINIS